MSTTKDLGLKGYNWLELDPIYQRAALARMTGSPTAVDLAFHLTGSPGTAKTAFNRHVYDSVLPQVADFHKVSPGEIPFVSVMATNIDAMDVRGLPTTVTVDGKTYTEWARPGEAIMPLQGRPAAYMFIDEIDKAPTVVRNPLYQGLFEGRFGEHKFPDNTFMSCASNLVADRSGGTTLEMHGRNRMIHFLFTASRDSVLQHFGSKGYDPAVLGFLKDHPDFMYRFNPKADSLGFPTLRSWEAFCQMLATHGLETLHIWGPGTVGDETTAKIAGHIETFKKMPSWEDFRAMDPSDAARIIKDLPPGVQYGAISRITANVKTTEDVDWMIETTEKVTPDYAGMAYTWLTSTYKAKAPLAWKSKKAVRFHTEKGMKLHAN